MTQKELLYLEDAINHEMSIIQIIDHSISNLSSEEFINYFNEQKNKHLNIKNNLINLLKEKTNE